jgi:hypothetical protein
VLPVSPSWALRRYVEARALRKTIQYQLVASLAALKPARRARLGRLEAALLSFGLGVREVLTGEGIKVAAPARSATPSRLTALTGSTPRCGRIATTARRVPRLPTVSHRRGKRIIHARLALRRFLPVGKHARGTTH